MIYAVGRLFTGATAPTTIDGPVTASPAAKTRVGWWPGFPGHLDQPPGGARDAIFRSQKPKVNFLADGKDDGIAFGNHDLIFKIGGRKSPLAVEDPFHFSHFDAGDFAISS